MRLSTCCWTSTQTGCKINHRQVPYNLDTGEMRLEAWHYNSAATQEKSLETRLLEKDASKGVSHLDQARGLRTRVAAPEEMPHMRPSLSASCLAISTASSEAILITSSMMSVSQFPGMNPAPMPWILWGPGFPPESTGLSVGSTATICNSKCGEHGSQELQHRHMHGLVNVEFVYCDATPTKVFQHIVCSMFQGMCVEMPMLFGCWFSRILSSLHHTAVGHWNMRSEQSSKFWFGVLKTSSLLPCPLLDHNPKTSLPDTYKNKQKKYKHTLTSSENIYIHDRHILYIYTKTWDTPWRYPFPKAMEQCPLHAILYRSTR